VVRVFALICALAVALGGCGNGEPSASATSAREQPAPPYRLDAPDARFELPGRLDEISGLTALGDGLLGAVQDEKGNLYVLDAASGEVVHQHDFGGDGDYEGVERVRDWVVVLRSDGRLFVIDDWQADEADARAVDTGLHGSCDAEGLAFDAEATRLLIACKESPGRGHRGSRAVYAFDPTTNRLDPTPAFIIHADSLASDGGAVDAAVRALVTPLADLNTLKPSALAVHPRTGEVWVLSFVRKALVVLARSGAVEAVWPLADDLLPQPEGLAFFADGTLFISSEARGGTAVLLRFDYRPR
jgi:uncharacterized protein YjiK